MELWILVIISMAELVLFAMLLRFFTRLRKSEAVLMQLSQDQQVLMDKLQTNAELERDIMQTFSARQAALQHLNSHLEARAEELRKLLEQADAVTRSPQSLREIIINGARRGRTPQQLAKATGLSVDEVELILAQGEG